MPRPQKRKAALAGATFRYSVLDAEPNANILKRTAADGNAVRPAMTDPNRESEKQKAVTTHHGFPWTSQCTITTQKYSDRGQKVNLFKDLNPLTVLQPSCPQSKTLRNNHAI